MTLWLALNWLVVGGCFAVLLGMVARMLIRRRQYRNVDVIDEALVFDIENYRPMERLLCDDDLVFLKSLPGYRSEIGKRWKRERRRLFRLYLTDLKNDFRRLHMEARRLVTHADAESADLVNMLVRQRWVFLRATTMLEIRLALAMIGVGRVDAAPLLSLLEAMRADLMLHGVPQTA
jgi:hypothetical protein